VADANVHFYNSTSGHFINSISEYSSDPALKTTDCSPEINNSTFRNSNSQGIYCDNSSLIIRGSLIENNADYGIYITGSTSIPDLGANDLADKGLNTIQNNDDGNFQVYNNTANTINAYYNIWEYDNADSIDAHIYDDDENPAKGEVLFEPWLTNVLVAEFSAIPTSGNAPLTVNFTDLSIPGTVSIIEWQWDFQNDGTIDSYDQNPIHIYDNPGTYTVSLTVTDENDSTDTEIKIDYITVESISPTANFSADTTSGYAPLTVNFTDLSIPGSWPIVAWEWDFGDSTFSNEQNPTHEYISVGNYTVSLTVFDEYNTTDIMTVENLITIINRAPYVISEIPDQIVEEDFEAFTINLDDHFADDDGDDLIYLVEYNSDEIQAAVDDSILTLSSVQDWFGTASIVVTANDGHSDKRKYSKSKNRYRASCSDTFDVVIQPVNDAPILNYFIPEDTTFTIKVDSTVMFTISAYDVDSEIQFSWFIDDENQEISDSIFTYTFIEEGGYEVKSVVSDEEYSVETVWHVTVEAVSVDNNVVVIYQTKLYQNTPNPFNPETKICFDIKDNNSDVSLAIYDIKGQLVKRLVKRNYNRGKYSVIWNGKDNNEKDVPSGIYFFKMEMDKFSNVKKCILLK
ncbi:MAG: hypothetical protein DRH57_09245, partial [Candidatus Cloacimonadota bacterium]